MCQWCSYLYICSILILPSLSVAVSVEVIFSFSIHNFPSFLHILRKFHSITDYPCLLSSKFSYEKCWIRTRNHCFSRSLVRYPMHHHHTFADIYNSFGSSSELSVSGSCRVPYQSSVCFWFSNFLCSPHSHCMLAV